MQAEPFQPSVGFRFVSQEIASAQRSRNRFAARIKHQTRDLSRVNQVHHLLSLNCLNVYVVVCRKGYDLVRAGSIRLQICTVQTTAINKLQSPQHNIT
ncbi:hypothetical protein PoB_001535400 [Plakobranchus ocellatus]|uniref:Uncharacterized protein n=1 Tax=Plakobranchus ocellatus TaxID=259542 RepID=A0AAV3Z375_9GAST|nr:hypothetical protein PoB_001535400 [Plakobranchus ocellatus]